MVIGKKSREESFSLLVSFGGWNVESNLNASDYCGDLTY